MTVTSRPNPTDYKSPGVHSARADLRRAGLAEVFGIVGAGVAVVATVFFIIGAAVSTLSGFLLWGLLPTTLISAVLSALAIVFAAISLRKRVDGHAAVLAKRGLILGIAAFLLPALALIAALAVVAVVVGAGA